MLFVIDIKLQSVVFEFLFRFNNFFGDQFFLQNHLFNKVYKLIRCCEKIFNLWVVVCFKIHIVDYFGYFLLCFSRFIQDFLNHSMIFDLLPFHVVFFVKLNIFRTICIIRNFYQLIFIKVTLIEQFQIVIKDFPLT